MPFRQASPAELRKRVAQLEKDNRRRREFYSEHFWVVETLVKLQEIERLTNQLDERVFADFPESEPWRMHISIIKDTTKVLIRRARTQWATFWED